MAKLELKKIKLHRRMRIDNRPHDVGAVVSVDPYVARALVEHQGAASYYTPPPKPATPKTPPPVVTKKAPPKEEKEGKPKVKPRRKRTRKKPASDA